MEHCIFVDKRIGETTSELADRVKSETGANKVVICGKLDPMAHGITRALLDENTKLMEQHLNQRVLLF